MCSGQTATPWSFVPRPDSLDAFPAWLSVSPSSGVLQGRTRQTLSFTARVREERGSGSLSFPQEQGAGNNSGPAISDLLILSVRGRDLFLAVSVESWIPTVLGSPLDHLVQLKKPIRETTLSDRAAIGRSTLRNAQAEDAKPAAAETVPLVVRRLVAFLAENGLGLPDLFQAQVEEESVQAILRCLDTASRVFRFRDKLSIIPSLTKRMFFHRATTFRKALCPIKISPRAWICQRTTLTSSTSSTLWICSTSSRPISARSLSTLAVASTVVAVLASTLTTKTTMSSRRPPLRTPARKSRPACPGLPFPLGLGLGPGSEGEVPLPLPLMPLRLAW